MASKQVTVDNVAPGLDVSGELGVLQFEDWEDTGAEYERMQLDSGEIKSA